MEKACELCHITLNKNSVLGDLSAFTPGGVRIGTPAMTSRGLVEADVVRIADFLHEVRCWAVCAGWVGRGRASGVGEAGQRPLNTPPPGPQVVEVCADVHGTTGAKLIKDFAAELEADARTADIRCRIEAFSGSFPMPGFATDDLDGPQ